MPARSIDIMRPFLIAASVLALGLAVPALAGAQSAPAAAPTPIPVPTLPPSANPSPWIQTGVNILRNVYDHEQARERNSTHGVVSYFRRFDMQVQTGPNSYRTVRLHQGTVINPRGATPASGSTVDVSGVADPDGTIEANTITVIQ